MANYKVRYIGGDAGSKRTVAGFNHHPPEYSSMPVIEGCIDCMVPSETAADTVELRVEHYQLYTLHVPGLFVREKIYLYVIEGETLYSALKKELFS